MSSSGAEKKKGKKGKKAKDPNLVDISSLPLPPGWEKKFSKEKNKPYYIDHNTRDTYWRHPLDPKFKPKKPKEGAIEQKATEEAGKEAVSGIEEQKGVVEVKEEEEKVKEEPAGVIQKVADDDKGTNTTGQVPVEAATDVVKGATETEGVGEEKDTPPATLSGEEQEEKKEVEAAEQQTEDHSAAPAATGVPEGAGAASEVESTGGGGVEDPPETPIDPETIEVTVSEEKVPSETATQDDTTESASLAEVARATPSSQVRGNKEEESTASEAIPAAKLDDPVAAAAEEVARLRREQKEEEEKEKKLKEEEQAAAEAAERERLEAAEAKRKREEEESALEAERKRKAEEEAAELEKLRKEAEQVEATAKEEKRKREAAARHGQEEKLVAAEVLLKQVAQKVEKQLVQLEQEDAEGRLKDLRKAALPEGAVASPSSKKAVSFEFPEGEADKGEVGGEEEGGAEESGDIFTEVPSTKRSAEDEERVEPWVHEENPNPYDPTALNASGRSLKEKKARVHHSLDQVCSAAKAGASHGSLSISHHLILDVPSPLENKQSEPLSYTEMGWIENMMSDSKDSVVPLDTFADQTLHNDKDAIRRSMINTNAMLSCANKMKRKELETKGIDKTDYYSASRELQVISNDVKPVPYPDEFRDTCLKCTQKFGSITRLKHHCYSCGEMYCHGCASQFWPLDIRESVGSEVVDSRYAKPVRVCDYCLQHLCSGDLNSMLRYIGVVRVDDTVFDENANIERARVSALHALSRSIEWEQEIKLENRGKGNNANVCKVTYPGLYAAAKQIGGWEYLWRAVLENLNLSHSPEVRNYACKIAANLFKRIDSFVDAFPFFELGGLEALGANLEDEDVRVGATYALYLALAYFPIEDPVQLAAFEGTKGCALLKTLVKILQDDEIKESAFRTLLTTTLGLLMGSHEQRELHMGVLDNFTQAKFDMAMLGFTHREEAMHKIAMESLGKLLRGVNGTANYSVIATNLLRGGIIDSTLQYLDWSGILKEQSYNQILATEHYHSLAFFEVLSEAFESHTQLLVKRKPYTGPPPDVETQPDEEDSGKRDEPESAFKDYGEDEDFKESGDEEATLPSVYEHVVDNILASLMAEVTEYRAGNEGWQLLVSTALSLALNLMAYEDFDDLVPFVSNSHLVTMCLDILMMPHETDIFLEHQAIAVLSHYGYQLNMAQTLLHRPGSTEAVTAACIKIISASMDTLRGNYQKFSDDEGSSKVPSDNYRLKRMSMKSKLVRTVHRFNPSDIMAFHMLSVVLYHSYTGKMLELGASTLTDEERVLHKEYADGFYSTYDTIVRDEGLGVAINHYLDYLITEASHLVEMRKSAEVEEGGTSDANKEQDEKDEEDYVHSVPMLQFLHVVGSCRGSAPSTDAFLAFCHKSKVASSLKKILSAAHESKHASIMEGTLLALGSIAGATGYFPWEEHVLELTFDRLRTSAASSGTTVPTDMVSRKLRVEDSTFGRNVGGEQHPVSAYEKALLTFARQRAYMDVEASFPYLQPGPEMEHVPSEFRDGGDDGDTNHTAEVSQEVREVCKSIAAFEAQVRAIMHKMGTILSPALANVHGPHVTTASLRLMQATLRAADKEVLEGAAEVVSKSMLKFTQTVQFETTAAIVAMDVLDLLITDRDRVEMLAKNSGVEQACENVCSQVANNINSMDPIVIMKAVEAAGKFSNLKLCHGSICEHMLPVVLQILDVSPTNNIMTDVSLNIEDMFRSALRMVSKLARDENSATWTQQVLPTMVRVLPTFVADMQYNTMISEITSPCLRPHGSSAYYEGDLMSTMLRAIAEVVKTHEPNLRYALLHPSMVETSQGIIGQVVDQLLLAMNPEDAELFESGEEGLECMLQRTVTEAITTTTTTTSTIMRDCMHVLYIIAGAHFEPTTESSLSGRKLAPLSIEASSLRTTLNLYKKGDQSFLSRRSYLLYRILVKLWHQGDATLSTQALAILVRAGCGYVWQDHSSRLGADRTRDNFSLKPALSSMPWSALVEDRQLYLLFDILDKGGKLVAGVDHMGDKEAVLFRTFMIMRQAGLESAFILESLPSSAVAHDGREEQLMLRVHLEQNTKSVDTVRSRPAGSLDPSSTYEAQAVTCVALRKLVHELRYIPHEKPTMVHDEGEGGDCSHGDEDDNADSDMEGSNDGDDDHTGSRDCLPHTTYSRDTHFPAMRAAVIDLCMKQRFMVIVQELACICVQASYLLHDVTRWSDVLLTYSAPSAVGNVYGVMMQKDGVAQGVHESYLSILCTWAARSHHHPKLLMLLLERLDRKETCASLQIVLDYHVIAMQRGGFTPASEMNLGPLCRYKSIRSSLEITHQLVEVLRLFFIDGHDNEAQLPAGSEDSHAEHHRQNAAFNAFLQHSSPFYDVHLKTGLSLVRALTIVFGCELQNMAGNKMFAVQEQHTPVANRREAENRQLEGVDPVGMTTPVKSSDASPLGVTNVETPLSPWIRTPAPDEYGGDEYTGGTGEASVDGDGEDEDEEDGMWSTDVDHHADAIEIDLTETMRRFWRTYVSMTGEAAFVEALVHSTHSLEHLYDQGMSVVMELLRLATTAARDDRRHGQDAHLLLIEHCVTVLSHVHEHRPSELVRILVANGDTSKLAAVPPGMDRGDAENEEEEEDLEELEQDQALGKATNTRESYVEILTRYVSHCYANLADDKPSYTSTSYEIVRILSSLSAISTPLCKQILTSNDRFLNCCTNQVVRVSNLVVDARENLRMRLAVATIEYVWRQRREMWAIRSGRKALLESRRAEIDRIRARRQQEWRLYQEEQDRLDALRTDAEKAAIRKKEEEEEKKRKKEEEAVARQSRRNDPTFYKRELKKLYKEHCPEKLKNIPVLLETFKGREEVLLEKVYAKYGIPMPHHDDEDGQEEEDSPFSDVDPESEPSSPIKDSVSLGDAGVDSLPNSPDPVPTPAVDSSSEKIGKVEALDLMAESSEKDADDIPALEVPVMAKPVPVEAPMDLPVLPDPPALTVTRTEFPESPKEVGNMDIWLALLVNLCRTRRGRVDVLVECSPILEALLKILPPYGGSNNAMSDNGRRVHTLHSTDFAYRIASIREGRPVPKDRTLAACMSLANCLCPALHGAASVVGYALSPKSIEPPVAKSRQRVREDKRRLASAVGQEKVGFFASLFSRPAPPAAATATAPTSTTGEDVDETENEDVLKTSHAARRDQLAAQYDEDHDDDDAPQLLLSGGRSLSAQECSDLILPHGPTVLRLALDSLHAEVLDLRLVTMSLGVMVQVSALAETRELMQAPNTLQTLCDIFPRLTQCAQTPRMLRMPGSSGAPSAHALSVARQLALQGAYSAIRLIHMTLLRHGNPPPKPPSSFCRLLLQLAVSLQPSEQDAASVLQLEVGWLPIVTHVTEILHLLSLDVQSRETILSLVKSKNGKTEIPLQPASYSTTKKTIKPMLLLTQIHSVNTVIKPVLNAPLNTDQYIPTLIPRNDE